VLWINSKFKNNVKINVNKIERKAINQCQINSRGFSMSEDDLVGYIYNNIILKIQNNSGLDLKIINHSEGFIIASNNKINFKLPEYQDTVLSKEEVEEKIKDYIL
jgi:hypothetical protein